MTEDQDRSQEGTTHPTQGSGWGTGSALMRAAYVKAEYIERMAAAFVKHHGIGLDEIDRCVLVEQRFDDRVEYHFELRK